MKLEIDRQVIVRSVIFTLTLVVPTYVVAEILIAVADIPKESNFWFLPFLFMLVEIGLGGARAARLKPEAPLSHGAVTAVVSYLPFLIVLIVVGVARGHTEDLINIIPWIVFPILMVTSAGMLGAMLVETRRNQARARRRRHAHHPER